MRLASQFLAAICLLTPATAGTRDGSQDHNVIENFLSLEWEAGTGDVPDDFILARPGEEGIAVDRSGRLFVMDEDRMKVFDSTGGPLQIVGGPGQGPGEFENCRRITISETGFLTVSSGNAIQTVHVFSPELEFLDRYNYRSQEPLTGFFSERERRASRPRRVVSYSLNDRMYYVETRDRAGGFAGPRWETLVHESYGTIQVLCDYSVTNFISIEGVGTSFDFLGALHSDVLENRRVVYSHTVFDVEQTEEGSFYLLRIERLDGGDQVVIRRRYTPVPVVDDDIAPWREGFADISDPRSRQAFEDLSREVDRRLSDTTHKAPLARLLADRHYIFAVTYTMRDGSHLLTDVFEADTGAYLSSVYMPCHSYGEPGISLIRDGFAYEVSDYWSEEPEEPTVRRYRIDSRVYGPH